MSAPDRLPDEAIDGLLDGSPSEEAAGTPLATYLAAIREDAETTAARPSEALQTVLAEGLDPAELQVGAPATTSSESPLRRSILGWRLRSRTLGRVLVTKVAALGLLGKAAVAGAAVTVAASSAGAAGVLPEPAQHAFDDAVGREVSQAPAEPADAPGTDQAVQDEQEPPRSPSGDTSTTPPLETDVAEDATGGADGEPGVNGRDIAEDASDGRSEDAPGRGAAPREAPPGPERGDEAVENTPARDAPADDAAAERAPDHAPPADHAGTQESPDDSRPATAKQGDAEQRPDTDRSALAGQDLRS